MTIMIQETRDSKRRGVVVLDGIKVSTEKTGVAPLRRAMREALNPDDELLVLTLLYVKASESNSEFDEVHLCDRSCEGDPYVRFLREEISRRKEVYKKILRPFYHCFKNRGVKFQVKIVAGFLLKDIIVEEANNFKATWMIMDSCFATHLSFQLSGTDCNVSLVSDEEEAKFNSCLIASDELESSDVSNIAPSSESQKVFKTVPAVTNEFHPSDQSLPANFGKESENVIKCDPIQENEISVKVNLSTKETISHDSISAQQKECNCVPPSKANICLGQPLKMSWETIVDITYGFKFKLSTCSGRQTKNYIPYRGYLREDETLVLVKRFKGDFDSILEAEKKAALSLQHKNILGLIGYHKSEDDTILIFPYKKRGTLDKYLFDLKKRKCVLRFQDKLKIALLTAQAVRYMHQECPRGPIVHGKLLPSNIFLASDFQPMISGFEHATWLQLKQPPPDSNNSFQLEDSLDNESTDLVKSDVLSFGILLLRLFCGRSVPQDDKLLIEWARPLLFQRAFHLLTEEDSDDLDLHAIYRVMTAATLCTRTKPISRPYMCEVISILEGKNFCPILQSSPSDYGS